MIIPYTVDVPFERRPWANYGLIALTVIISLLALFDDGLFEHLKLGTLELDPTYFEVPHENEYADPTPYISVRYSATEFLTHVFVHGGFLHLLGNMIFLFVFGNAVNYKLGNLGYLAAYFALAIVAAGAHVVFDGNPAVGASGAINGIIGLFLIFFPLNNVSCFYLIFYKPGEFSVSSVWIIAYWILTDVLLMWYGLAGNVAVMAHLGGVVAGMGVGLVLVASGVVRPTEWECTLLDVVRKRT